MLKPYVVKLSKNNLQEGIVEQKKCEKCGKQFTITNENSVFLKKIYPSFNDKTFEIPAPKRDHTNA
jgi:hypothetical protein